MSKNVLYTYTRSHIYLQHHHYGYYYNISKQDVSGTVDHFDHYGEHILNLLDVRQNVILYLLHFL